MEFLLDILDLIVLLGVYVGLVLVTFYLAYYLFGCLPYIRARKLTEEERDDVRKGGLSHKTSAKGRNGILSLRKILGKSGIKAYSYHFRKAAYLLANAYKQSGEQFNFQYKYKSEIDIHNLTEEQIDMLMIRDYDKAIICPGDFVFDDTNRIEVKDYDVTYTLIQKVITTVKALLKMKIDRYVGGLVCCTLAALVILLPVYCFFVFLFI